MTCQVFGSILRELFDKCYGLLCGITILEVNSPVLANEILIYWSVFNTSCMVSVFLFGTLTISRCILLAFSDKVAVQTPPNTVSSSYKDWTLKCQNTNADIQNASPMGTCHMYPLYIVTTPAAFYYLSLYI